MPERKPSGGKSQAPPSKVAARWVKRDDAVTLPRVKAPHPTIEVDSRWLIPSIPEMKPVKAREAQPRPQTPPASLAVKPKGKLPPPIPRDDRDDRPVDAGRSPRGGGRTSKRPPRA